MKYLVLFDRCRLFAGNFLQYEQRRDGQHNTDCQQNIRILRKPSNHICDKRNSGNRDCVGQLRRYVIDMVTLSARRSHNCRIGNRRAMVAANRAGKTSRNTDNQEIRI